jgi:hypothetical protein
MWQGTTTHQSPIARHGVPAHCDRKTCNIAANSRPTYNVCKGLEPLRIQQRIEEAEWSLLCS